MRVDVVPRSQYDQHMAADDHHEVETISCDLPPDATSTVISGLTEKTDYVVAVRAVTAVYFDMLPDGHAAKRTRRLAADRLPTDDAWLPAATAVVTTSGTDRPGDVRVVKTTPDSITLEWTLPRTYGSDQLQGTVIRWVSFVESFKKATRARTDNESIPLPAFFSSAALSRTHRFQVQ